MLIFLKRLLSPSPGIRLILTINQIMDYKMKVELGLRTRENQQEWYGKRGISLHGFLVIAQLPVNSFLVPFLAFFDFAVKLTLCLLTCTLCLIVHACHFGFVNCCVSLICLFDLI